MWCTETTAPRPLPEPFHLASTRSLIRLDSTRLELIWWLQRKARKARALPQSHLVTFSTFSWPMTPMTWPMTPTCNALSTPSLRRYTFFFCFWNSFRMDHKECGTTRPPGSAHAMPSMISGRDKVLVGRKKLAMDRSLRPPIFKLQWSQNNTNYDDTNVQMQSSSWQKLRDKWGQVIFWML